MTKHQNDGACPHCLEIVDRFPSFNVDVLNWFKLVQAKFPNFHIAEAGRGRDAQEADFADRLSRAHYGQSAHNFNCAIDTFFEVDGKYSLDEKLYEQLIPEIPMHIEWYGAKGAQFYERPHFELRGWRNLLTAGLLKLVES